jgi:hypothetical protein
MKCPRDRCDGEMRAGKALGLDHSRYRRLETISVIAAPLLIDVAKCDCCGHSVYQEGEAV